MTVSDGELFDLLDEAAVLIDEGRVADSETLKCVYREAIHEAIRRLRESEAPNALFTPNAHASLWEGSAEQAMEAAVAAEFAAEEPATPPPLKLLPWFLKASAEDVVMAIVEDGSVLEVLQTELRAALPTDRPAPQEQP